MAVSADPENAPNPTKKLRWATQRLKGKSGSKKRGSILGRLGHRGSQNSEKKRDSAGADSMGTDLGGITEEPEPNEGATETSGSDRDGQGPRTVYFNQALPPDAVDEQGHPLKHYRRNKIRTAKYTPISFIPKNLWYQFHNIANVYFLFLIILTFFGIFGASNPGLNAVPLIVIVVITAIKDAIEDYRRTILDIELNNSPVHRLVDWNNVNVSEDDVSLWRRFKKASTRGVVAVWGKLKRNKKLPGKDYAERALDEPRESYETRATADRRVSAFSAHTQRTSFTSARENIQMTPVPSPGLPRDDGLQVPDADRPKTAFSYEAGDGDAPVVKNFGNLINPTLPVTGGPRFHSDYWKNVKVGDFVRIYNDDQIPADIVILSTSDPDGACYVETKNLDGETNLKVRHALRSGRKIKHARDCERTQFVIESEPPHPNLYQYSAVARWTQHNPRYPDSEGEDMAEPISINNLLLRGCNLRNTDWILGVVVYTGFDTKIMMNSGITPSKRSRIARELNWNVIYNFIILFIMCLVSGLIEGVYWGQGDNSLDFFEFGSIGGKPSLDGLITFWAAVILFQNLVPISLYISIEIVKTCQAFFIYSDTEMYYEKIDYPCTPKSWNISDDLGQIEYIFSDKTGTLTQNVMEFKKATINGVPYGEAYTEAQAGMQKRQGIDVEKESARAYEQIAQARVKMLADIRKLYDNPYLHDDELTFVAPDFISDLAGESTREQQLANEQFMLALALCHTVIAETIPAEPPRIEFKAQSPDEAALVATARDVGYTVLGNSNDGIRLNIQGEDRSFKVLNTLEFNSTRKRMSAIIRMPDNKIILFCKGADSIIYSRLKKGEQSELRRTTAEHLEMFAREGLRTLCIAQRELGEHEYQEWNREHEIAAAAISDREDKLEAVSDLIERDLTLLGGTAIEDRLQEGVPDTIALLAEAGIKLWVLTGDKVETAINIGFSCNLLNNDMELIIFKVDDESVDSADVELDKHLATFNMTGSDHELAIARKSHAPPEPTHAIVIDGDSLKLVLDERLRQKFLLLCKQCKSVLCCRVSPAQKAAVVAMVKTGLDVMTLSIGDGANDVAMIQEADVGVGIAGEEGRQAVMSADYAIGQFRFLQRLVLVHGRWSYRRLGEMIANFFYKNIVWTFTIFWYQIFCSFDMTYLYDYTYILLFNLAFTSVPVVFMGVLDQDVNDKVSLAVPQLYRRGIERKEWTQTKFWLYMFDGLYQSVICFFMAWLLFRPANFVTGNGLNIDDRERFGVYIAPAALMVINVYILINTYRWDWLMVLLVTISVLLVWFWTGVYSAFKSSDYFYKAAAEAFAQASFWAVTFLSTILALMPRFCIKFVQKIYFPYDVDIIREQVRQGKFAYLDVDNSAGDDITKDPSTTSSDIAKPSKHTHYPSLDEDQRPIYPPSVAATATTHNPRSQNGSDGTDFTRHRASMEQLPPVRQSMDRARPSYDRIRASMDRIRPSFEQSRDFTSAAMLTRLESSHSFGPTQSRRT
ncbi:P-type ATPase-like protein [Mollisia scopiformis]|uniref:Phospholipid-transporting ATPase n=1 Tax=Mollisia scopiformis TaxID=149040 RepID=A0A194XTJ8_MOLSC|nr:P-type ATPase-like protein [Mollisia scopiformis]KUJ23533.1 P-type ATPase-like protein [Mollisia scopiformis]